MTLWGKLTDEERRKRVLSAEALMKEYAARIVRTRMYVERELGPWRMTQRELLALLDGKEIE